MKISPEQLKEIDEMYNRCKAGTVKPPIIFSYLGLFILNPKTDKYYLKGGPDDPSKGVLDDPKSNG